MEDVVDTLLARLPVGVLVLEEGRVVRVEGTADELLGRSARRLLGSSAEEALPEAVVQAVHRVQQGASGCTVAGVPRRDGLSGSLSAVASGDREGRVIVVLSPGSSDPPVSEDFDRRRRWLAGLAGGLAHEIKNPLGGIRGAAQLLRRAAPTAPRGGGDAALAHEDWDELTSLIIQESDRIRERVERLMDLTRTVPLRTAPVSLNRVVHDAVALLRADEGVPTVAWDLDLDPSLPVVQGDPVRLWEAVGNLLRNAAEAAESTVTVRTRLEPEGRLKEQGADRGRALRVDVRDDGPGIAPSEEPALFAPFSTTKLEGSGLGLFVARLAVEAHAGVLRVDPGPGIGACFTLLLWEKLPGPVAGQDDASAGASSPRHNPYGNREALR